MGPPAHSQHVEASRRDCQTPGCSSLVKLAKVDARITMTKHTQAASLNLNGPRRTALEGTLWSEQGGHAAMMDSTGIIREDGNTGTYGNTISLVLVQGHAQVDVNLSRLCVGNALCSAFCLLRKGRCVHSPKWRRLLEAAAAGGSVELSRERGATRAQRSLNPEQVRKWMCLLWGAACYRAERLKQNLRWGITCSR